MTSNAATPPKFFFLSPLDAEIVKISLNSFITTKIAFANTISDLCDVVGANKHDVLHAIGSDSRIGTKYFKPGYSFGGPCFPRDTKAMKQLLDQHYIHSRLLEATTLSNADHVSFQTQQILQAHGHLEEFVIEDVCYKEGAPIPIIEESAKLKIAKLLVENGKRVIIKDIPAILMEVRKEYGTLFGYMEK